MLRLLHLEYVKREALTGEAEALTGEEMAEQSMRLVAAWATTTTAHVQQQRRKISETMTRSKSFTLHPK